MTSSSLDIHCRRKSAHPPLGSNGQFYPQQNQLLSATSSKSCRKSVQAPTTNLSSNDPWRSTESPPAPKTPRLVLECEKSRRAEGDTGKHRDKDSRGRRHEKPDTAATAATHLRHGPAHTRKASTSGMDRQTR